MAEAVGGADSAPLWTVLVLPLALVLAALAVAAFDAALAGGSLRTAASPVREVARLLVKQPRRTRSDDVLLLRAGVVLLPVAAVLAAVVLPVGFGSVSDLPEGVVWFNAMEALAWAAVWLAGWGPNSTLSLIGGYRFLSQGLAYELPHMMAITTVALAAGSLRIGDIVRDQAGLWYVVWMPVAFVIYLLSALAMAFWGPFDQPVGADIAGGAAAEHSGVDRILFRGGRWLLLVVAAAFSVPFFLGGGHGPWLPGWAWTIVKTAVVLVFLVGVRRQVPTIRMERYLEVAWVVLLPLSILQALVVAVVVLNR